jgi:hypothetical protein
MLLLMTMHVKVKMRNVGDPALIRHHSIEGARRYADAREIERLSKRFIDASVGKAAVVDKRFGELNFI